MASTLLQARELYQCPSSILVMAARLSLAPDGQPPSPNFYRCKLHSGCIEQWSWVPMAASLPGRALPLAYPWHKEMKLHGASMRAFLAGACSHVVELYEAHFVAHTADSSMLTMARIQYCADAAEASVDVCLCCVFN
jgi:hypothetical protein